MQDIYANSNEGMVLKLVVSLEQGSKNKPLENPSGLRLICFKTSHLNLKKKIHFKPITCICCSFDTWHTYL